MQTQGILSRAKKRPLKLAVEASIFATLILGTAFFLPQTAFAATCFSYFPTTDNFGRHVGSNTIGNGWALAQQFTNSGTCFPTDITITSWNNGGTNAGVEMYAQLWTESGGEPDTLLETSSNFFIYTDVGTSFSGRADLVFSFSGTTELADGVDYMLVLTSANQAGTFFINRTSNDAGRGEDVLEKEWDGTPEDDVWQVAGSESLAMLVEGNEDFSDTTRIIETTPASGETIATSTAATFGATGYVNEDDFEDGMFVQIKYAPYSASQAAVASPDLLFTTLQLDVSSAGDFDVSTTSPVLTIGKYTMQTEILTGSWLNSTLNFFGFGQFANYGIVSATSTTFVASELSGYDTFIASSTEALNAYYASSTISFASCSEWTSFNLLDCLNLLFVPQTTPIAEALDGFKNGFLQYAPWGYLTRTLTILTGNATTSLPAFSATVKLGSPNDEATFSFDIADMLSGGGALLNSITEDASGDDLNVQEVLQPIIRLFIALTVVFVILRDLMNVGHPQGSPNFQRRS